MTTDTPSIFKKTTPIGYKYDSNEVEDERFVGTGFFYQTQYTTRLVEKEDAPPFGPYLVTNRHIVKPHRQSNPDQLTLYLRRGRGTGKPERVEIRLYDDGQVWFEHQDNADLAVILLDEEIGSKFTFHRDHVFHRRGVVSGGDLAHVVGYPGPLPEFNRLPVVRNALISSPYQTAYEDSDYFFVDARLHEGMSGSPVLAVPVDSFEVTGEHGEALEIDVERPRPSTQPKQPYLLGIHSEEGHQESPPIEKLQEQIDRMEEANQEVKDHLLEIETRVSKIESETGLNRAWHAHLIEEIITQNGINEKDAVEVNYIRKS